MTQRVVEGTVWQGTTREDRFQVIHVIVDSEGHEWVHYRKIFPDHCQEYSCWTESFLQRFSEVRNESR